MEYFCAFILVIALTSAWYTAPIVVAGVKASVDGYIDRRVNGIVMQRIGYVYEDLHTLHPDRVYWTRHGFPRVR